MNRWQTAAKITTFIGAIMVYVAVVGGAALFSLQALGYSTADPPIELVLLGMWGFIIALTGIIVGIVTV